MSLGRRPRLLASRLAWALAGLLAAGCATAGDASLLASVPPGRHINPPERSFPAASRLPLRVAYDSWTSLASVGSGMGGDAAGGAGSIAPESIERARQYFQAEGDFPTLRITVALARPQMSSGAEAQLVGGVSASRVALSVHYTVTVEDWENPARAALERRGTAEVTGTLRIGFDEIRTAVAAWTRAVYQRGVHNALVDVVDMLDRSRAELATLAGRYAAWRGRGPQPVAASRLERIRRVEQLLDEAERLVPGGAEAASLRQRLDAIKRPAR